MILLSSVDRRPHGQAVKTSPSHGEISGSIPLGATRRIAVYKFFLIDRYFCARLRKIYRSTLHVA